MEAGGLEIAIAFGYLTQAQCNARALALWRQLSMHEYKVTFSPAPTAANLQYFDVTTFFGIIKFDSRGLNVYKPMVTNQIQNGNLMTVWPLGVQNAKPM